jgi:hypothetical protein
MKPTLWWATLPFFCSCALQPEKRESWVDLPASRTQTHENRVLNESPWVSSQRMVDRHESSEHPVMVGAYALRSWLGSEHLQIWDLNPESVATRYPKIPQAISIKDAEVQKYLGGFKGSVVLVSNDRGQDRLDLIWKKLRDVQGVDVLILAGGIEAWAKVMENP